MQKILFTFLNLLCYVTLFFSIFTQHSPDWKRIFIARAPLNAEDSFETCRAYTTVQRILKYGSTNVNY